MQRYCPPNKPEYQFPVSFPLSTYTCAVTSKGKAATDPLLTTPDYAACEFPGQDALVTGYGTWCLVTGDW